MVYLHYTGVVDITPELGLILQGKPEMKTTDFGNSCKPSFHKPTLPLAVLDGVMVFRSDNSHSHRDEVRDGRREIERP